MIDPFVILTPILVLGVLALVRFVGCFTKPAPPAPHLLAATTGDQMVLLTWQNDTYTGYTIKRGTAHGGPYSAVTELPAGTTSFTDSGLANGTEFFYVMTGHISGGGGIFGDPSESDNSNEVSATPIPPVTFDNPPPPGNPRDLLTAPYKNLDFKTTSWIWLDPAAGGGPANGISLPAINSISGDISFVNGDRLLEKLRVFPKRATTVTISDGFNPAFSVVYQAADANLVHFINTADFGWSIKAHTFTIGTDIGFDLIIDTIVYDGPV